MIGFAIPGDLAAPTGGYVYARRVMAEWARAGIAHRHVPLPAAFPAPDAAALRETAAILADAPRPLLIDGLAYGAFPEDLARQAEATVLLHHPLCDETGLDAEQTERALRTERAALVHARHVVVTSPLTARDLVARFGVEAGRITVAEPGLDRADPAPLAGDPPHILAVGSVTPRKGYGYLVEALARCADLPWTCTIHGETDRDAAEAARIAGLIEAAGLSSRIALRPPVPGDALHAVYRGADVFVAPSLHEGYGMAVTEAMAHGLPVVASRAGALPETAPVARLVPPGDVDALRDALHEVLMDAGLRRSMGAESHAFARSRPGWDTTARIVAQAMGAADPLAPLARRDGDPVFEEAWQAQALAMADCLVATGAFSASDWAAALGRAVRREEDTTAGYYRAVLAALESLLDAGGTVPAGEMAARRAAWARAYETTPHGAPVELPPEGS